jgi:hypothetical protein
MHAPNGPRGSFLRSLPIRFLIRSREYRNPGVWLNVRLACAIFNLCLSAVMFSLGLWEGVFPLAGAALIFWTRSVLQHSVPS